MWVWSMILVDPRAGSIELFPLIKSKGVECELLTMEYADVAFTGNGPSGLIKVGVEYKTVSDALACMVSNRFTGHQLPGLAQTYNQYWLLLEGTVKPGAGAEDEGVLMVPYAGKWRSYTQGKRFVMWRDWQHWLASIQIQGNCKLAFTSTQAESVAWITAMYSWWAKPWEAHRTMQTVYTGPVTAEKVGIFGNIIQSNISLRRLWAMQLPGVGNGKSKDVEATFPTALDMANAGPSKWTEVDGIGEKLACKIWSAIRETK